MSHIPLRKIYLFTLAFSIVSWLFGNERLPAPQGFRGGCLGGGCSRQNSERAVTYGFASTWWGGGAGAHVWAGCETTGTQGEGREGVLELDAF